MKRKLLLLGMKLLSSINLILKTVISSYPKQGVSKLCYNVAILSRLLGDNATDLEVGTLFQYLLV